MVWSKRVAERVRKFPNFKSADLDLARAVRKGAIRFYVNVRLLGGGNGSLQVRSLTCAHKMSPFHFRLGRRCNGSAALHEGPTCGALYGGARRK